MSLRRNVSEGNGDATSNENTEKIRWSQLQIDWSGRQHLLRNWLTDDTHVKHLLRVLFDHTKATETDSFMLLDTIAREMSTSRRTAQRAVKQAVKEDLLIVYGPKSNRRCNTFRLRMANIFDRARTDLKRDKLASQECQPVTPAVPTSHSKGAKLAHRSNLEVPVEPPPKCGAGETPAAHPADEWTVVVEELIAYGVGDPEPAVEKARRRGCSAPFVRRVIDYARSKVSGNGVYAWGGGALRKRVFNLVPGHPIDDISLWLPVDPAYEQTRLRELAEQQEVERCRQKAQSEASIDATRLERKTLETKFGNVLDSLSENERETMITELLQPFHRKMCRKHFLQYGRIPQTYRMDFLKHLAETLTEV